MITYVRVDWDDCFVALLKNLSPEAPGKIKLSVNQGFSSLIEVFKDGAFAGLLVIRGEKNYDGELVLVILHAVATVPAIFPFNEVLKDSLFTWAKSKGFKWVRFHTGNLALCRMFAEYFDEIQEVIFLKDVSKPAGDLCKKANLLRVVQRQVTIKE